MGTRLRQRRSQGRSPASSNSALRSGDCGGADLPVGQLRIMRWFEQDPKALEALEATLRKRYPTLHAFVQDGIVSVRGTYPVMDAGREIDRYSIAVNLPERYPHELPEVFETGERIPRILDRHVFTSGALCLGVREELWLILGGNFSIEAVLDGPVRGFLIGNGLVEEGEKWPDGDRSHGMAGILEFYGSHLGTNDPLAVLNLIGALIKEKVRGHWNCPCGSGAIIRNCHKDAVQALRNVPKDILAVSGVTIMEALKK